MARILRKALDLTLYSIRTARPVVTKLWGSAKNSISSTKVSVAVNNPVVSKAESLLESATSLMEEKLESFRDQQLPGELKYLEEEIRKVKERMSESGGGSGGSGVTCQIVQSNMRVAWPYMRYECVPPMTMALFDGPFGKSLESMASAMLNTVMNTAQSQIKSMDAAAEKKKRDAEAKIRAAEEKAKAEEEKKKLAAEKKALDEKLKAAPKEKGDAKQEAPKKDDKKEPPKAQAAAAPAKKEPPKPKPSPPQAKKDDKKDPKKK